MCSQDPEHKGRAVDDDIDQGHDRLHLLLETRDGEGAPAQEGRSEATRRQRNQHRFTRLGVSAEEMIYFPRTFLSSRKIRNALA